MPVVTPEKLAQLQQKADDVRNVSISQENYEKINGEKNERSKINNL
jgi:hypothetical protein